MENPTSVGYGQPWFSRCKVAPELEEHVFSASRKVFYNSNGEDLRLKEPGFNWSYVPDKRHQLLDDCKQQLTSMFDQFYEKITGQKSNRYTKIMSASNIFEDTIHVHDYSILL